ncbi:unnamed protein product [Kuraishia capsulata CBS 1993]|uniref:Small ribosomal subunit protein uS4m n=1 Tax=Kuraishia capsulata CBS 1993 TaxID=1382522 RepID=W6MXY1_9ASCO|nr:uncharacterized protein KUCA_T00005668001 [Kuraishia capsulata CBS 1993]CDK29675.1 unnamed protein product [Kuraishia capsulata CBS 1993]
MPRKTTNLYSLPRGVIRASWNKWNLFNLYKQQRFRDNQKTLFKEKWSAKNMTRAYHGEHITESKWKALFTPQLDGVAQLDASLKGDRLKPTPMMLQTYAVLERRLEYAVFRAMFASSVRQARQFIIQKAVKVNGVTIRHPSYQLKPNDVFSVDPEKVLQAVGRTKPSFKKAHQVDQTQIVKWNNFVKEAKANPRQVWERLQKKRQDAQRSGPSTKFGNDQVFSNEVILAKIEKINENNLKEMRAKQKAVDKFSVLEDIVKAVQKSETIESAIFEPQFGNLKNKCYQVYDYLGEKHELFNKDSVSVKDTVSAFLNVKPEDRNADELKKFKKVKQLLSEISLDYQELIRVSFKNKEISKDSKDVSYNPNWADNLEFHPNIAKFSEIEDESSVKVALPWQKGVFGRQNPNKSYFTPWEPRPFLAPFAVLPHHLEISFKTCHAVYLRHPVARPGHSEVISPYSVETHERAYMYYVRKGQ